MMDLKIYFQQNIQRRIERHLNNLKVASMAVRVQHKIPKSSPMQPVLFFKATSGIDDLSWNSAFQVLTAWGLRLRGVPVEFFACDHGMSLCILGTDRDNPTKKPPCASCVYQSKSIYTGATKHWFNYQPDPALTAAIKDLSISELEQVEVDGVPYGKLVLPGLRWILRRHNLFDDTNTRFLYRQYILSARNIALKFSKLLEERRPSVVVVFNGQFFPEATAKWVARSMGIKVISHEVGLRPMTAFFTEGESTAYPIHIPNEYQLNDTQNQRLDAYLEQRFQGNFTMGGVKFWQSIKPLDPQLLAKFNQYKNIAPVFTNVVFDTSQPHANTNFEDMFKWLDLIVDKAQQHPETLFIIRAHPDETRLRKASLETVEQWYLENDVQKVANIHFIPPNEFISSYELIQQAKFVLIYNSTIGLEASLMGATVLCAGKARFTQIPTVFYPASKAEYEHELDLYLSGAVPTPPAEFMINARKFLYFQLFRSSLPFEEFLVTGVRPTHAKIKWFQPNKLIKSITMQTIYKGLFEDGDFLLEG